MTKAHAPIGIALLLLPFGCGHGSAPSSHTEDAGTDAASLADVLSNDAGASARDAGASAPDPVEPAAYLAYVADAEKRCRPKEPESSTWGMVRDTERFLGCHAEGITRDVALLSPEARGALLEGDPSSRPEHPERGSTWSRTIDAVCELGYMQRWVPGGTTMAGSMCHNTRRWCFEGPDLGLGFLVRAWLENRAGDVAAHVRVGAAKGRPIAAELAAWERYAAGARKTAPFGAMGDRECPFHYRLRDADWIAFERTLGIIGRDGRRLGAALCNAWPALATELGGAEACARSIFHYTLAFADKGEPWEDGEGPTRAPDPVDAELPPPADEDLLVEAGEVRRRCDDKAGGRCFAEALRAQEARGAPVFASRMGRWVGELCTLPDLFLTLRVASASYHPSFGKRSTDATCDATSALLRIYAYRRLASGSVAGLAAHVRGRQDWGTKVKADVDEAARELGDRCQTTPRSKACDAGTAGERAQAAAHLRRITDGGAALAKEICRADKGLSAALGDAACPEQMERYLFSYGTARLDWR